LWRNVCIQNVIAHLCVMYRITGLNFCTLAVTSNILATNASAQSIPWSECIWVFHCQSQQWIILDNEPKTICTVYTVMKNAIYWGWAIMAVFCPSIWCMVKKKLNIFFSCVEWKALKSSAVFHNVKMHTHVYNVWSVKRMNFISDTWNLTTWWKIN
jgi:hypothetical protein